MNSAMDIPARVVPPGRYFMMGDNRDHSRDSRDWGTVRKDEFKGPVFILYWSWDVRGKFSSVPQSRELVVGGETLEPAAAPGGLWGTRRSRQGGCEGEAEGPFVPVRSGALSPAGRGRGQFFLSDCALERRSNKSRGHPHESRWAFDGLESSWYDARRSITHTF